MLYRMVSTTNEKFKYLEGTKASLIYDERYKIFWFNNFHTSQVQEVEEIEGIKVVTTLNSVYKFEKLEENV